MTKKILVVDDSEDVRILVGKWLKDSDYKVIVASDGNDAIKKLKKDIDMVFLDIMMPGPSPQVLLEKVKKKSPKALVIYLSAIEPFNVTPEQERKGWTPVLEPPVMGYLQKPINKDQLLQKINDAMQMHETILQKEKKKKK